MRLLVLGHGKTGKLVAEVAHQRGHGVHVLDAKENRDSMALTAPFVTGFDVIIDFTTPEAAIQNMRACLATGARMVVGTTGWYPRLNDMRSLADRKGASLLYGTNFSVGVQLLLKLTAELGSALKSAGYTFAIEETHHSTKLDSPSGTALTLAEALAHAANLPTHQPGTDTPTIPITAHREGDHAGEHRIAATSDADQITLTHTATSRRGFAEGAVRAAEWLGNHRGIFDFKDIFEQL